MKYLTFLFILLSIANGFAQPKIQIEGNDIYDWGKIDTKGNPLTGKVKIFNIGTENLIISQVKPGCGCTTAPLDRSEIEPKGFATLSITLNVSNDGNVQKSIRISSNDPQNPDKNLIIKANIVRPIGLSQKYLNFDKMEVDKESKASLVLQNNTGKTITIKEIVAEPEELKTNIKKNTKILAGKELTLVARYTPLKATNFSGKITIKTDNKDMKTIELSTWGTFMPKNIK